MLIKINPDTYIDPECVEAVQKQIIYLGSCEDGYYSVDIVIFTRGGHKFYYDGTMEECLKKLGVKEAELQEVTPDGTTT
jgi:hypothetical protein